MATRIRSDVYNGVYRIERIDKSFYRSVAYIDNWRRDSQITPRGGSNFNEKRREHLGLVKAESTLKI